MLTHNIHYKIHLVTILFQLLNNVAPMITYMNIHFNTNAWCGNTWVHVGRITSLLFICYFFLDDPCDSFTPPSCSLMASPYIFPWLFFWPFIYPKLCPSFLTFLYPLPWPPLRCSPWPCPPSLVRLVNYKGIFFFCYQIL